MRFIAAALVLAAASPKAQFQPRVLSMPSRNELERWISGGFFARLGVGHQGTVRAGQTTLLPIVAEKVPKGSALVADLRVFASDGRVVLNKPACCRATQERAPGLYVLEPVPELRLMPSDLEGLYTATATVRDQAGAERTARERLVLVQ